MTGPARRLPLSTLALLLLGLPLGAGEAPRDPQQEPGTEAAAPAGDEAQQPEPTEESPPPRAADTEPMEQVSADSNLTFPVDI